MRFHVPIIIIIAPSLHIIYMQYPHTPLLHEKLHACILNHRAITFMTITSYGKPSWLAETPINVTQELLVIWLDDQFLENGNENIPSARLFRSDENKRHVIAVAVSTNRQLQRVERNGYFINICSMRSGDHSYIPIKIGILHHQNQLLQSLAAKNKQNAVRIL